MPRNTYSEKKANYPEFKQGYPEFKTGSQLVEYGNTAEQRGLGGGGGVNYKNLGLVSEAYLVNNVEQTPNIYYRLNGTANTIVGYHKLSDGKLIAYPIILDGTGFMRINEAALGSETFTANGVNNYDSRTGTWVSTAPNYYTTQVGATIAYQITGVNKLSFYSYSNNAGGLWNFTINGGANIPISVYASTAGYLNQTISDSLDEEVVYTIVGTFAGQDPANPVATPRGWLYFGNNSTTGCFYKYYKNFANQQILQASSNVEFAYSILASGESYASQWIPFHNTEATMTPLSRAIKIDGVTVSDFTATGIKSCQKIEIFGEYNCFNTNETAQIIGKVTTYYKIDKYGYYVDHKYEAYVNQSISGYGWMLPVHRGFATLLTDNLSNTYDLTKINQSADSIASADNVKSFKVTSNLSNLETYQLTSAFVDNKAMRVGLPDRGNPVLFIENRNSETLNKIYCNSFSIHIMQAGETFRCKNIYFICKTT